MVSRIFSQYQDHTAPYDAGKELLVAAWSEQSLVLMRCRVGSVEPVAIEGFQTNWQRGDTGSKLLEQSALLPLRDLPLLFISCGQAALPIPAEAFSPTTLQQEIALFGGGHPVGKIFSHPAGDDMVIGWQVPEAVWKFFTGHFATVTCRHLLHGLIQPPASGDAIKLYAMGGGCWTTWWHQGKLFGTHYLNTESVPNTCYNLLRRCQLYGIQPLEAPLYLSGLLAADAPLSLEIRRFFGHLQWQGNPAPTGLPIGGIPSHYYHWLATTMPATINQ